MRLDLSPEYTRLSAGLSTIRQLAQIAEMMRDHVLVTTCMEITPSAAKAHGYRPLLLTVQDFDAFHFLIGHINDAARQADERLQDLEDVAANTWRRVHARDTRLPRPGADPVGSP